MKLKKISLLIVMAVFMLVFLSGFNTANASIGSEYLTIKELRNSGFGYKVSGKIVWKIVETNTDGTTADYSKTIYCLKAGMGFGSDVWGSGTITQKEYTRYFDLKEKDLIPSDYVLDFFSDDTTYNAVMWILENVYVPAAETASTEEQEKAKEYRELLLERAGLTGSSLTDDDIDVVQQLAIWHFTNLNEDYDVGNEGFELWTNYTKNDNSNYNTLSDQMGDGAEDGYNRNANAQILYQYFIDGAEANASSYQSTTTSDPYKLDSTTQTIRKENGNYIIGPYRINKVSNTEGTLTITILDSDENEISGVELQKEDGTKFYSIQETVDQEFYIVVPDTTNVNGLKLTINCSYYNTNIEYWAVGTGVESEQPVVIVEREKIEYDDEITLKFEEQEEIFDLALRKFITKINGEEVGVSREPVISTDTLNDLYDKNTTTTTATKIHTKTPIAVSTGDVVEYTIRVYNEGNIDGVVESLVDYLSSGLKLKEDSDINKEYGWFEKNGILSTSYLADKVIEAFDGTELKYLDVKIECEVIATEFETNTILRNIAEIKSAYPNDSSYKADRDSTPNNLTDEQKNNYNLETSEIGWGYEDDDDYEDLVILGQYFDLSLRKFITQVNDTELKDADGNYLREPEVDVTPLLSGTSTTAIYNHSKEPVGVSVGDEIVYTIRVYNEGQIAGYVYEIKDYLPENLEFIVDDELNSSYGWQVSGDGRTVTTTITSPDTGHSANRDIIYADRKDGDDKVILEAFDGEELDYIDVQIKCRVTETVTAEEKLTNIAEITDARDWEKNEVTDRDSIKNDVAIPIDDVLPNYRDEEINRGDEYIPSQEDDDDFDKVVVQKFDLALKKFITGVNEQEITNREPIFSIVDGEYTYTHTKDSVEVEVGDIVIYTLRVYNEGSVAGYAVGIKDDIPEGLEFLTDDIINIEYRWVMYDADGNVTDDVNEAVTIRTDYLSKAQEDETGRNNLIEAFDTDTMSEPAYKEVKVAFRVVEANTSDRIIISTAEISEDADENGDQIEDIDSTPNNDEEDEDDIDIEKIKLKYFDLSLSEFITGVNDEEITNKISVFSIVDGECTYIYTENPVEVASGDIVIYTIRVYNEGTQAGYAEEVTDNISEGLEFLLDNSINIEYEWVMYDADGNVTEDVNEAVSIKTDYLSKAQEDETGRDNLIEAFDADTMTQPDYKDLQIAFKVTEPNTPDRVIINTAEITDDADEDGEEVEDIDSTPDNDDEDEDDIDEGRVEVTYFDLALKKIVSEATVIYNGETTIQETGYTFEDDQEEVVKIKLVSDQVKNAIIKFTYKIQITNEGNKSGYAYEIKDYVPEGLEFVAEDNNEYWTLSEDGKTVTSDELTDTLLEPGESAVIEITFRWVNDSDNFGLKTNWAEISKDSDDDIDSTPDNFVEGEDDMDYAEVVLSVKAGIEEYYVGITTTVLGMLAGGVVLIKRFVI